VPATGTGSGAHTLFAVAPDALPAATCPELDSKPGEARTGPARLREPAVIVREMAFGIIASMQLFSRVRNTGADAVERPAGATRTRA
jgi:hypothetical protein